MPMDLTTFRRLLLRRIERELEQTDLWTATASDRQLRSAREAWDVETDDLHERLLDSAPSQGSDEFAGSILGEAQTSLDGLPEPLRSAVRIEALSGLTELFFLKEEAAEDRERLFPRRAEADRKSVV